MALPARRGPGPGHLWVPEVSPRVVEVMAVATAGISAAVVPAAATATRCFKYLGRRSQSAQARCALWRARTEPHRARTTFCTQPPGCSNIFAVYSLMLNMNQVIPLEEAARRTGVHRTTLSRAVKRGELRARTVQAHGKTRFWLDPSELEAWVRERAQAAPCAHEDAPSAHGSMHVEAESEPSTVYSGHPGSPEFVRLLELLECAHERARCASVQAVRLQHELHSYQRALTEHAESLIEREARAKTAEARLLELEQRQQELEAENGLRLQEAVRVHEELTARVRQAEERVSWFERRVPRWVRRALGGA